MKNNIPKLLASIGIDPESSLGEAAVEILTLLIEFQHLKQDPRDPKDPKAAV